MDENFDAYFKWLGIPPEDQPPNHYRLLGVPRFVDDPAVIENAADQRMAHLRVFQTGQHGRLSQKLLNEVAAARVCLLNAERKTAYDAQLRERLDADAEPSERSDSEASAPGWTGVLDLGSAATSPARTPDESKRPPRKPLILGIAGVVAVAVLGLALWWMLAGGGAGEESLAQANPQPSAQPAEAEVPVTPPASAAEERKPDSLPPLPPLPPLPSLPPPSELPEPKEEEALPEPGAAGMEEAASRPDDLSPEESQSAPETEAAEPATAKITPPSTEEQKRLSRTLDEVYQVAEVKDQAAKTALARKLLTDASQQAANRAEQFVMFRRASELARDAGDVSVMLEAVDAMVEAHFNISPWTVKVWLLKAMLAQADPADATALCAMADSCVTLSGQAAADGAFDEASDVLDAAKAPLAQARSHWQRAYGAARLAARRARTPADKAEREKEVYAAEGAVASLDTAVSAVAEHTKGLEQARREHEAVQLARERLKTDPDDPEACLAVGRWLCFDRGDWDEGLKLLAKGSDAALKALAAADLAPPPATADARVGRGDAWWDASEKSEGRARSALRRRAGFWYEDAVAELSGLAKTKVEGRLAQAAVEPATEGARTGKPPPPAVAPFDEKTAKRHQVLWSHYLGVPVEHDVDLGGGVKLTMVLIPPGEFMMGSPDAERQMAIEEAKAGNDTWAIERIPTEAPRHRVRITRPFYLGKYEVTQAQWLAVMGNNPSQFQAPGNPVEQVSWENIQPFLAKLNTARTRRVPAAKMGSAATAMKFALPTEAQWEYACRAGTTTAFCFGDNAAMLGQYGWVKGNSDGKTHPVGELKANAWGLHDMLGNVWEWCADRWAPDYYANSPMDNPPGPGTGSDRVRRGGGWNDNAGLCRSAHRSRSTPVSRTSRLGFRLALVPADE